MRVILDITSVANTAQSSYRYFAELIPRFRKLPDISLEMIPSPYFPTPKEWVGASEVHKTLLPKAGWLPQGHLRKNLSKIKWAIEAKYLKRQLKTKSELAVFHSFLYTLPPAEDLLFVPNALDLTVEKYGLEIGLKDKVSEIIARKEKCFRRADRILAISQSTKDDLVNFYSISPDKVDVVYLAANPKIFSTPSLASAMEATLMKYSIAGPFLLQVGGRMHHRNFSNLLKAFALENLKSELSLVAAGDPWSEEEKDAIKRLGLQGRVLLAEHPSDSELRDLYQSAEMLVYPSLYEGFGFPLIEAMASGLPVATSAGSGSIPEVAGDAALYFDPRNPNDIAKKIKDLMDPKLQESLVKKGYENIKRFNWDETARKTVACYQKALGQA